MPNIHSLDTALIDQIAAGEVIERPASVVKELIENSIDSNSTKIEINIINGGHKLIQVIDNGIGMDCDDLKLAVKRHATSKIKTLDDLNNIKSLGFRGEGLPSIASISMFTAISSSSDINGYKIQVNGGLEKCFEPSILAWYLSGPNIFIFGMCFCK